MDKIIDPKVIQQSPTLVVAMILLALVLVASAFRKLNVPVIILSLMIGLIFGSDVLKLIHFNNAHFAKEVANLALMFILFIGGFGTNKETFKPVLKPVMLLATVGVVTTAIITGFIFHLITGWDFLNSLLLGSIISSTDAAAMYAIFRNRPIEAKTRTVLELESVANDPMAIVLTTFVISLVMGKSTNTWLAILNFTWQMVGGVAIGAIVGYVAAYFLNKIRESDTDYFFVYLIAVVLLTYSLADMAKASGLLATFSAGFVMGNSKIPLKNRLLSFSDTLSFITNVALFILLGLLASPKSFSEIWGKGVLVFLIITLVSRPITVFIFTAKAGLTLKQKILIAFAGIRGSVPIVLATYPLAAGLDPEREFFNMIFFTVTLSIILQGTGIFALAKRLKLLSDKKNVEPRILELVTVHDTNYEIVEVYIDDDHYTGSCLISELTLPPGTLIAFVNRRGELIAPSGQVEIVPNDVLTVLVDNKYVDTIHAEIHKSFDRKKTEEDVWGDEYLYE
ncbi:MAG TPA: potassium/proton antiporter [Candidatus Cloacimonadota bacterium]|nr:potassium/proton antiporter [Candidatus Cloacimonadota bacterium]